MTPLRFEPYHLIAGRPNVVVDGAATDGTVLTLSHWPGSPTPVELLDDLSAQIALRCLERPDLLSGVSIVSNNHFDQDGLTSAFALVDPDAAWARRDRLVDVARAGDFATYADRDSFRTSVAIAALEDPSRSTLPSDVFVGPYEDVCGHLYEHLLPRLADMLDHPEASRALWEQEDSHLTESLAAIDRGVVTIEERADLDLAVVVIPETWADRATSRFTISRHDAVHPAAVNTRTDRFRILTMQGSHYRLECRYETWVMYRSRPVMPRPDLRLLADVLAESEPGAARWVAAPPGALTPALRTEGAPSELSPTAVRTTVEAWLQHAEPAWDPYAVGG